MNIHELCWIPIQKLNLFILCIIFLADVQLIKNHVSHVVAFIEHIYMDPDHSEDNLAASCGLIG